MLANLLFLQNPRHAYLSNDGPLSFPIFEPNAKTGRSPLKNLRFKRRATIFASTIASESRVLAGLAPLERQPEIAPPFGTAMLPGWQREKGEGLR